MTPHKATPEQWVNLERRQLGGNDLVCAALELRAKVEALEAAAHKHIVETNSNIVALFTRVEALEANYPEKPDSSDPAGSLVEQLVEAVYGPSNTQEGWRSEARAAIREVAAWLRSQDLSTGDYWAGRLEQEARR